MNSDKRVLSYVHRSVSLVVLVFSDIVVLDGCSGPPGHVALHKLITEVVLILHKKKIFSFVISLRRRISSEVFPVRTARSSVRTRKTEGEIL